MTLNESRVRDEINKCSEPAPDNNCSPVENPKLL